MNQEPTFPVFVRPDDPCRGEPFEGDLFDRKKLAEQLTGYLSRLPEGCVFGIDAPWGEGKSWFGRNWQMLLNEQGFKVIYLDAFQRDYIEDPFLMISGEILGAIKESKPEIREKILGASMRLGKALLPFAAKAAVGIAGRLVLGSTDIAAESKKLAEAIQDGAGTALEKQIRKRLEEYETDKQSIENFRDALSELATGLDKPLVVFVDELDRCRPDFAVKTIERIKHFFDVPKVVFILLLNRQQLVESIKGVYGAGLNANAYLGKFIQFSVSLPKLTSLNQQGRDHNQQFCVHTLARYGFPVTDPTNYFARAIGIFATSLGLSFRDIERAVVLFSIAQPARNSAEYLAWPIVLKLCRPEIFQGIREGRSESHQAAAGLLTSIEKEAPEFQLISFLKKFHNLHETGPKVPLDAETMQELRMIGGHHYPDRFLPGLFERIDLTIRE